jgi:hypothetical protein
MKIRMLVASIGTLLLAFTLMAGCSAISSAVNHQQTFGPTGFTLNPQQDYNYTLPGINKGNTVNFNFSSSGALVYYTVYDPNNNTILTGDGGNKVASGAGSFVAASSGNYTIQFHCSGVLSSSSITISGTIN